MSTVWYDEQVSRVNKIKEIRRRKLISAVRDSGLPQVDFAKSLDINPRLLSNHLTGSKPIGEKAARGYESKIGLASNFLDFETLDNNVSPGPELIEKGLPLISTVTAGNWEDAFDAFELGMAEEYFSTTVKHGPRTYCLRVVGDSMFNPYRRPSYFDGDIIVVDPDQAGDATNNSPVIARLIDESMDMNRRVTFKRLVLDGPSKYLSPINSSHPDIHSDFEVIGLVLHGIYI